MKLQVDITALTRDDCIEALLYFLAELEDGGKTRGRIDDDGITGLFELLDNQPAT